MKELTVFILAAGDGSRWDGPIEKQLVHVHGSQPLIQRTEMQVQKVFGAVPFIVTNNIRIISKSRKPMRPTDSRWIVETLLSTAGEWGKRVIVLLGDTYYTDRVLEHIRNDARPIDFFGRLIEIYGLSFTDHKTILKALNMARKQVMVCPHQEGGNQGRLWHLWYILNGYSIEEHTIPNISNPFFRQINPDDITIDLDTWDDYIKLVKSTGIKFSDGVGW